MYRIDNATAITPIPVPAAVGPNPNYFFTKGNPAGGIPATIVDDDWLNAVQEELCNILTAFGIAPDKTKRNQLATLLSSSGLAGRVRLQANTTFYVRSDGSDANTGLVNNAGGAFLTLQHAADTISNLYDLNGFAVGITFGDDGARAGATFNPCVGQKVPIIVTGHSTAGTIINTAINLNLGTAVQFSTMKIAGGANGFVSSGTCVLQAGIEFGALVGGQSAHLYANGGGSISIQNNYAISGGGGSHFQSFQGGISISGNITITLTGTPAFATGFAFVADIGQIVFQSLPVAPAAFVGGATGTRYNVSGNSILSVNGLGATYLPGNASGAVANGGQYF